MTSRDLEVRDAVERLDRLIEYLTGNGEGWAYVAADIADALWTLMPDIVERRMPETTHLVRAGYWPGTAEHPGMAALKRAVAVPHEDDDVPEDDVPF
jgi:hypothetical protein